VRLGVLVTLGVVLALDAGIVGLPRDQASPVPRDQASPVVLLAGGSLDPSGPGGLVAVELPSGRMLGRFDDIRRQGGGFARSADGRRGYVLDGPYFSELELPSLRRLRSAELPNPINILGQGRVVVASPDGTEVYVETTRIIGPTRWDPRLYTGQPDSEYGIAVYDVAQGSFTREFQLDAPWCGVAELYSLADGRLAVMCTVSHDLRLVDPKAGKQTATIGGLYGGNAAASRDGTRLWVLVGTGQLQEVDLARMAVTRSVNLAGDPTRCSPSCVPFQRLHVSADGTRLFVRAAPDRPELRSTGHGSVVWVVDTLTLQRVAEVALPAPAFDAVPTPDGQAIVISNTNTQNPDERATRLVDVATGRVLAHWPGAIYGAQSW
jgi:DNA-binding beta-propeller fold protein YncE